MLTPEQIAQAEMLEKMTPEEREAYLKEQGLKEMEGRIPDKYKGSYNMAKSLYSAEDKKGVMRGFVPDSYKSSFDTAVSSYDKVLELKK